MSKFEYGSLPRVIKPKGFLPGHITKYFGPKYIASGYWKSELEDPAEYGEFVEVGDDTEKAYLTEPVDNETTADQLAVVVRDVAGAPRLQTGIIEGPKREVPLSLFIGSGSQKGKVVVILGEQETEPEVGATVFVGRGTGATVAGTVYTTEQGADGVDSIEATNWKFAGTKFAPTTSGAYVVEVEYVG